MSQPEKVPITWFLPSGEIEFLRDWFIGKGILWGEEDSPDGDGTVRIYRWSNDIWEGR